MPTLEEIKQRALIREQAERQVGELPTQEARAKRKVWEDLPKDFMRRRGFGGRIFPSERPTPLTGNPIKDFETEWVMAGDEEEETPGIAA